jgi:alpha-glucosidase
MKFRISILAAALLFSAATSWAQTDEDNPVADPLAVVVQGNARFTVLTPELIRMEWAEDGQFEDRASFGFVNRRLPVPQFTVRKRSGKLTIKTSALTLTYTGNSKFDAENLSITFADPNNKGKKSTWRPGMAQDANLLGTTRTLDGFDASGNYRDFSGYDIAPISRDGWAVYDESSRFLFEKTDEDWKYWLGQRPEGERQDLYFFGYGHDYKAAVSDYIKIGGKIPMPPKYMFGYWWCRYWQYSDAELYDLMDHFKAYSIPIDVFIIDMDWHEVWDDKKAAGYTRDEAGQSTGWTGLTWNSRLFPNPTNTLHQLHDYGVKVSLNHHPASGVQTYEEPYERMVKDYTSRTSDYDGPKGFVKEDGTPTYVPYRMSQIEWADAYFNSVIHPFEKQGVDFWWLDWQQYMESKYVKGLSNTFWINYAFFTDMKRQSASEGIYARRPVIYHRWGGIGSHRYQIGFSGDTYATWKVLGALPKFTATSSNVGYGYWGHDIGGHMQPKGVNETNPELYTRWLQYGVFTPIYKTHSTKNLSMEKRFWVFPDYFDAMRAAIRLRYDLSPYIYGAARQTYDTGICMTRPLYYDYPELSEAYDFDQEYMFGDDILGTVIDQPCDSVTGLADRKIWLPGGTKWYDAATGNLYDGGQILDLKYTVNENPFFVKAGAIIPLAGAEITSLQEPSNEIRFAIAPGAGDSETVLYEDDGTTQAYETEYATTKVSKSSSESGIKVTIGAREGSYRGMPSTRRVQVILEAVYPPKAVRVNGSSVPYSRFPAEEDGAVWTYEGKNLRAVVYLPESSASQQITVEADYDSSLDLSLLYGKKGIIGRMAAMTAEAKIAFGTYNGNMNLPDELLVIAQCGSFVTEDPANTEKYLKAIDVKALETMLSKQTKLPSSIKTKLLSQCLE